MKTVDELEKIVKDSKENTQAAYNAIGDRILHEIERLSSEGKKDEDGYIHVEDFGLHDSEAEYSQGDWDCDPIEWIYIDKDGLNFGNGYGDWTIEDFDLDDLVNFVKYLTEK